MSLGALTTTRGALPLKAVDISVHIDVLLFRATLTQTFVNTLDVPLEATYVFPLPDRTAVAAFRFEVQGRTVLGRLDERQAARDAYNSAIAKGQRAATAEEDRAGAFTTRIGNLQPNERATVTLELEGACGRSLGEACFRFPLVIAPRFTPGTKLDGAQAGEGTASDTDAAPDASRVTPPTLIAGSPNPVRLSLEVVIDGHGIDVSNITAPLHRIAVDGHHVRLEPSERLDKDFILTWKLGAAAAQSALLIDPREKAFVLMVAPPQLQGPRRPRDVVFVLDRSGSMNGWKMSAAARGTSQMIEALGEGDHLQVIAFDDITERAFASPTLAATDENRCRAVEFVSKIAARGGTQLGPAMNLAAALLNQAPAYEERERCIVLITDGQITNEDQVLRELGTQLKGARVHGLGIDQAPNAGFLSRLARAFGGHTLLSESEGSMHQRLEGLKGFVVGAELTEPTVSLVGAKVHDLVPDQLPNISEGHAWFISGRYDGREPTGAEVRGTAADGRRVLLSASASRADVVRVWARERIRMLEDRFALGRGDEREIIKTSLDHGVLSRFTAFVGIDGERVSHGDPHRVIQPVEQPGGWQPGSAFHFAAASKSTRAGILRGKFFWGVPERMRGLPTDARSMVFAFTSVMHYVLTGQRLFARDSDFATLRAIIDVELPARLFDGGLAHLEAVFRKALSKDPDARGTIAEVVAAMGPGSTFDVPQVAPVPGVGPAHAWQLLQKLATGGDTEVWLADSAGKHAVVSRLLPYLAEEPEVLELFLSGARVVHPNVAELYERGHDFLVWEYLEGVTLDAMVRRQPLTLPEAAHVAQAIAAAVERLAQHRIFSDDLEPRNLFLCSDGRIKLTGFRHTMDSSLHAPVTTRTLLDAGGHVVGAKVESRGFWNRAPGP